MRATASGGQAGAGAGPDGDAGPPPAAAAARPHPREDGEGFGEGKPGDRVSSFPSYSREAVAYSPQPLCVGAHPPPVFLGGNGPKPSGGWPVNSGPCICRDRREARRAERSEPPARQMSGAADGWSFTKQRCSDSPEARRATAWERPAASACLCRRHALPSLINA